jgi:hypothetical protein
MKRAVSPEASFRLNVVIFSTEINSIYPDNAMKTGGTTLSAPAKNPASVTYDNFNKTLTRITARRMVQFLQFPFT